MNTPNTDIRRPRHEQWQELITQHEQSGLTVQAFCAQQGVTAASFYQWRKQLRDKAGMRFALVEHSVNGSRSSAAVELVLASGERVQVAPGTDAATLRMVLGVLRERA